MKYLSKFNILIFIALPFYCAMAVAQVKPISIPTNIGKPPVVKKIKQNISVIAPDEEVEGEGSAVNESSIESEGGTTVIRFSELSTTSSSDFFTIFSSKLLITPNDTFSLLKKEQDNIGFTHYRFQQHFKGVPLDGVQFLLHEKNGKLTSANGNFYSGLDINITPSISKQEAIQKAIQFVGAEKYLWDNPKEEQFLKTIKKDINATYSPKAELVIAPINGIYAKENFRLCYRVNIFSEIPYDNVDVYIDALTGEIINKIGKIAHADVTGTANTLYSGTKTISMKNNAGTYTLEETSRPIQTFNMQNGNGRSNSDVVDFTNTTSNWTAKETVLNSITISSVNNNWIDALENTSNGGKPDLYIQVKDANNNVIWSTMTKILNDVSTFPITIKSSVYLPQNSQYTLNIYDDDSPTTSSQLLGSFNINPTTGNNLYTSNGTSGSIFIDAKNSPGLDAHWGAETVFDYFNNKHSRNSFDNSGGTIYSFVHANIIGMGIDKTNANAFWNGNVMIYGDGDSEEGPQSALDVCGHELTHAVVDYTSGFIYQAESGALDESFADIFGTAIEFYDSPLTANYTFSEKTFFQSSGFTRSLKEPKLKGQPNTYESPLTNGYWKNPKEINYDSGGVHKNSGVQNYWFYLLCEGGTNTNDLGNTYSVSAIGIEKSAKIAYRNLAYYLTPNSTYKSAFLGSLIAVEDLYPTINGVYSQEYNSVRQAWYAVGVGSNPALSCEGITDLTAQNGTFTDGSGALNYNNNANCKWVIAPAGATKINLNFTAFNTQSNIDKVYVYNGPDDTYPLLATWWGNTLPSTISTTNGVGAMCVKFVTDATTTLSGWSADYTSTVVPPACSGITSLITPTGSFDDGSGTANYTNNQQCYWYIAPPCATSVTLNFTNINTESNYDWVVIYDSLNGTNLLGKFSGTTIPNSITSSTGQMVVVFISDYANISQGFTANYTSTGSSYCSGVTVLNSSDTGGISDGSGANKYCNNMNCSWLIQPPQAQKVTFNFISFNLQNASADGRTIYDAVEIYDGINDSAPLLGRFTGSTVPNAVTSTGGSLFIKFYTDYEINFQGWSGYYTSTQTPYCNGIVTTLNTASGTLSDGSGTDKYANNANCAWLIQPTNAKTVTLNFTEFDTELNSDWVIIYDGSNNTAPVLGKFSGSTLPPSVTSTTGNMYVLFLSDEGLRANGWSANYTSTKPSIYNLVSTNFKLQVESNSCIGKKTGKISATITNTNYAYQVTVTGVNSYTNTQTVPVGTSTWSITGLEKGKYTICFAIASEPNQKQCFDIEVTEPEPLSVYAKVDNSTGIINLAMLGAKNYSVVVNGKTTTVSDNNFSTVLPTGLNTISVTTDKDCQGIYQQEIFISEKAFIYPNPTFGVLHLFVGGTEENIAMNLNNLSGATIKKMNLTVGETREVAVDLSGVPQGSYIITINSKTVSQSFKVIKL
jgi:Zn-dependent metalloprotease